MIDETGAMSWDDFIKLTKRKEQGEALKKKADAMTASSIAGYAARVLKNPDIKPIQKKRKKKVSHEGPVQQSIMKELAKTPGVTYLKRTNAGMIPIPNGDGTYRYVRVGRKGQSDIHFTYNGTPCAFEVKIWKPRKTYASPSQKEYLIKFAKTGIAAVVRSVADALHVLEVGKVGEVVQW